MSPNTRTNAMNRRDLPTRNGQATPIPQGGNVSIRTVINSLPAHPSVPSDQIYDIMDITNPTTMQVESASRREPGAENALHGPGGS